MSKSFLITMLIINSKLISYRVLPCLSRKDSKTTENGKNDQQYLVKEGKVQKKKICEEYRKRKKWEEEGAKIKSFLKAVEVSRELHDRP